MTGGPLNLRSWLEWDGSHRRPWGTWENSRKLKIAEIPKLSIAALIRAYQWAISPLFPPACRYVPTCSQYAMEAVDRHGALRGSLLAVARLLRCHPFAHGGFDPVPLHSRVAPTFPLASSKQGLSATSLRQDCANHNVRVTPTHTCASH
jgi:uncharacterized protein